MPQDKLLSLLGICRRAGRLQWGHDACLESVKHGRAKLCLLSADASERLRREFRFAAKRAGEPLQILHIPYTMQQVKDATGYFAGVLTTEDEGFAKRLAQLHQDFSRRDLANDQ